MLAGFRNGVCGGGCSWRNLVSDLVWARAGLGLTDDAVVCLHSMFGNCYCVIIMICASDFQWDKHQHNEMFLGPDLLQFDHKCDVCVSHSRRHAYVCVCVCVCVCVDLCGFSFVISAEWGIYASSRCVETSYYIYYMYHAVIYVGACVTCSGLQPPMGRPRQRRDSCSY